MPQEASTSHSRANPAMVTSRLVGIASAGTARDIRDDIWRHLADDWKPAHLDTICTREIGLNGLPEVFKAMLTGHSFGRTVVKIG